MWLLSVMMKTSRVLEGVGSVAGCAPVWSDSVMKRDFKADESGVLSRSTELRGSTVGEGIHKRYLPKVKKITFFL